MESTVTTFVNESEALKKSVQPTLKLLRDTNGKIDAQVEINKNKILQYERDIEQLKKDNEALALLKADNETFIVNVGDVLDGDENK